MKTIIIKDLAATCELSHSDMAAVRGGHGMTTMPWLPTYSPSYTSSIKTDQSLAQLQNVNNLTANGSAFVAGVTANNHTDQFGQNNIAIL